LQKVAVSIKEHPSIIHGIMSADVDDCYDCLVEPAGRTDCTSWVMAASAQSRIVGDGLQ
jgi:hypothetical protein